MARIDVHVDSELLGTVEPNFARDYTALYEQFHSCLVRAHDNLTGIGYEEFIRGNTLFCFDLSCGLHLGAWSARTSGQVKITFTFKTTSGSESLTALIIGEFGNWISVDIDNCVRLNAPI